MATSPTDVGGPAPLLLLGAPASGARLVAGLLARGAGVDFGDVLPTEAGTAYEAATVVHAHNAVMAALNRDWTCPPVGFDAGAVPRGALPDAAEEWRAAGSAWAVHEPRLLFMLPLWADLVPAVRMVGVVRPHEELVRSLAMRSGLEPGAADAVCRVYQRRLRRLCDRFDLPVVEVATGTTAPAVGALADALGLPWDAQAAGSAVADGGLESPSFGLVTDPNAEALRDRARAVPRAVTTSASALSDLLQELADDPDDLDLHLGPRAAGCRARVRSGLGRDDRRVMELVRTAHLAASLATPPGVESVGGVRDTRSLVGALRGRRGLDALLLPDVASWLAGDELEDVMRACHQAMAPDGELRVGLFRVDQVARTRRGLPALSADHVAEVARTAGFTRMRREDGAAGTVLAFVAVGGAEAQPRELEALQLELRRLRGRRSVRFALAAAAALRPVFRFVRRLRSRTDG